MVRNKRIHPENNIELGIKMRSIEIWAVSGIFCILALILSQFDILFTTIFVFFGIMCAYFAVKTETRENRNDRNTDKKD